MENINTFESLNLRPQLKSAVEGLGFRSPTPIQSQALPILLGPKTDFIGLAATGTGKTAAFALPLLQRLESPGHGVQAIVLCPTRELSMQVAEQISLLGRNMNVKAVPIYGGAGYGEQIRALKQGASVVVGTPGRIIDHIDRHTLKLSHVHTVVLDEADEMISMGFKEDIENILSSVPRGESNRWLFSATMSPAVRRVADEFLIAPKIVQVNRTEMLSSTVEQIYFMTQEKNKPEVLAKLIDSADDFYGVIFCQTKALVVELTRYLTERGYKADCLHGDMSQAAREVAMQAFRDRRVKMLVCTDVAARGLDVKDVSHVINFSIPRELDNYVHRIGRTARSGKSGVAMSLVTPSHRHLIGKIEKLTKSKFVEGQVPTRKSIGVKKIAQLLEKFENPPGFERALELMDDSWRQAVATKSPEEVAARFLALMYPWVFAEKVPLEAKLNLKPSTAPSEQAENRRRSERRFDRSEGRGRDRGERGGRDRGERRDRSERRERGEKMGGSRPPRRRHN